MLKLIVAVPPEMLGLPTWILNGLSVGSLVLFIVIGLATSRLWTAHQVRTLEAQHAREVDNLTKRYELHLASMIAQLQGRIDDAIRREKEWHDVADRWQQVAQMLGDAVDPMLEQNQTILAVVREMQLAQKAQRKAR